MVADSLKIFIMLISLFSFGKSEIMTFDNAFISDSPNPKKLVYEPMFATRDSPSGKGKSLITFDFKVRSPQPFQLAFFVIGIRDHVINNEHIAVCNSKSIMNYEDVAKLLIDFDERTAEDVELVGGFEVTKTGLYSIFFIPCGHGIVVSGAVTFKNPYGYLSGTKYSFLKYYNWMTLLYAGIFLVWLKVMHSNRDNLFNHHYIITLVVLCTLLEIFFHNIELHIINKVGTKNALLYVLTRFLCVFRHAFIRVIVVLVSFGYGVISLKIEKRVEKALHAATLVYLIFKIVLEIYLMENSNPSEHAFVFPLLLRAVLLLCDAFFFCAAFYGLSRTMVDMKCHDVYFQKLFKMFAIVLAAMGVGGVVFKLVEIKFHRSWLLESTNWKDCWWYQDGFWLLMNTTVQLAVMLIWLPSQSVQYKRIPDLSKRNAESIFANFFFFDKKRAAEAPRPGEKDWTDAEELLNLKRFQSQSLADGERGPGEKADGGEDGESGSGSGRTSSGSSIEEESGGSEKNTAQSSSSFESSEGEEESIIDAKERQSSGDGGMEKETAVDIV